MFHCQEAMFISKNKIQFFQFFQISSSVPEFLNLLSPGIESQPDGPVRQSYLMYRPARRRNQLLGSLKALSSEMDPAEIRVIR